MGERWPGNRIGIDWGMVRIGVAASNRGTTFAYPVTTVAAGPQALDQLAAVIAEHGPEVVYLGLPLNLKGQHGPAAEHVLSHVPGLAKRAGDIPIRLVDERLSTAQASRELGRAGRAAKRQRTIIDQAAAVEILQRALDQESRTGRPVGQLWKGDE